MSTPFRLTPRALADLDTIAAYTKDRWGVAQMAKYLRALDARFHLIAENPKTGQRREDIAPGYRAIPYGRHLIFYVVTKDGPAIIGIPHQSMDVPRYFNDPGT